MNPNYGYAAFPGATRAGAAANSLVTGDPLPVPGLTVLANPHVFNNPSATNQNNFAAILSRPVKLRGYDGVNSIFTYHFPNVDFKYIAGFQAYNYDLNYQDGDSNVRQYVLPGSSGIPAPVLAFLGLPPPTQLVINPIISAHYTEDDNWWSQEASLQSTDSEPAPVDRRHLLLPPALRSAVRRDDAAAAAAFAADPASAAALRRRCCSSRAESQARHPPA